MKWCKQCSINTQIVIVCTFQLQPVEPQPAARRPTVPPPQPPPVSNVSMVFKLNKWSFVCLSTSPVNFIIKSLLILQLSKVEDWIGQGQIKIITIVQVPPPVHHPAKVRSVSRDHTTESGLSRQSALNDRYFDKPGRSRSLDNLLSPVSVI